MSLLVWKIEPSRTSSSRSSRALTRLPLCADGNLPVGAVDEERLRVRRAGSRRPSSSGRGRSRIVPGQLAAAPAALNTSATWPIALVTRSWCAVGRGDAGALLPPVLQRVEARGRRGWRPRRGRRCRTRRTLRWNLSNIGAPVPAAASASLLREVPFERRAPRPASASRDRDVDGRARHRPVIDERGCRRSGRRARAGTPAAGAPGARNASQLRRGRPRRRRATADSPNSVRISSMLGADDRVAAAARQPRRRGRRCRSSTRPARRPGRPPSSRAPSAAAPSATASTSRRCSRALGRRGRAPAAAPRIRPCTAFRYSLPPSSPRFSPSSTTASPSARERAAADRARRPRSARPRPSTGVGRMAVPSVSL